MFRSRAEHIAAVYDACLLLRETVEKTDLLSIYDAHGLDDAKKLSLTCREIINLIAEGDLK